MTYKTLSLLYLVITTSFLLSGCGLYIVKKSDVAGNHQGIPFYVKTGGCKREIAHLKPYYLLTLSKKENDKVVSTDTAFVCRADFNNSLLDSLRNSTAATVESNWDALKKGVKCEPHAEDSTPENTLLLSDVVSAYAYVDYNHPYTLNVRRPVIGSASATTKLADDGTLSEGTAQVEDKTLETVLGLVPAADLIKSAAGIATMAFDGGAPKFSYELKIEEKAAKLSRVYHDPQPTGPCELDTKLRPTASGDFDFVVEDSDGGKKPDDDNAIKVSGSIQLPKSKDDAAKSKDKK